MDTTAAATTDPTEHNGSAADFEEDLLEFAWELGEIAKDARDLAADIEHFNRRWRGFAAALAPSS
jgi:hypothetical protein